MGRDDVISATVPILILLLSLVDPLSQVTLSACMQACLHVANLIVAGFCSGSSVYLSVCLHVASVIVAAICSGLLCHMFCLSE